jgi:hypothetical protein
MHLGAGPKTSLDSQGKSVNVHSYPKRRSAFPSRRRRQGRAHEITPAISVAKNTLRDRIHATENQRRCKLRRQLFDISNRPEIATFSRDPPGERARRAARARGFGVLDFF